MRSRSCVWQRHLARHWNDARFEHEAAETRGDQHRFAVQVSLGGLDPEAIRVEIYADPIDGEEPVRQAMAQDRRLDGPGSRYEYVGQVPASRPASDFTPRLVPYHPASNVPLEASWILWSH